MNLRHVSDEKLLKDIKVHMEEERSQMTIVLHHLREIEERKLFAALNYSSIYKYAMKELNLTEAEANARVAAARLLRQMPQVEEKIESGALSLTNVLKARAFFNTEKKANKAYTVEEKMVVLEKLENTSTRDGQRLLLSMSSKPELLMESSRVVSPTQTERKFVTDQALDEKLERIKGLWAHALPCATLYELIDRMADVVLEKIDPLKKAERAQVRQAKKQASKHASTIEKPSDSQAGMKHKSSQSDFGKENYSHSMSKTESSEVSEMRSVDSALRTTAMRTSAMPNRAAQNRAAQNRATHNTAEYKTETQIRVDSERAALSRSRGNVSVALDQKSPHAQASACRTDFGSHRNSKTDPLRTVSGAQKSGPMTNRAAIAEDPIHRNGNPFFGRERTRHKSSTVRHALWMRDGGQCTHVGTDGKRCESRHGLEEDHIIPFALGGESTLENLRLVCRAHNSFYAVRTFGVEKMRKHSVQD